MNGRPVGVRRRLPVLAAGGFALLTGLYAALLLLGLPVPAPPAPLEQVHGPLMVLGFVGTLVALERAVALGTRWALLAPASSGAGGLALVLTGPGLLGPPAAHARLGAVAADLPAAVAAAARSGAAGPGHYPFVSHVMVDAESGARGVFEVR